MNFTLDFSRFLKLTNIKVKYAMLQRTNGQSTAKLS